jgi:hypothetical protein
MTQYHLKISTPSHTDITRLRKGQVGGQVCFHLSFHFISNKIPINSFGQFIPLAVIKGKMPRLVLWNKSI